LKSTTDDVPRNKRQQTSCKISSCRRLHALLCGQISYVFFQKETGQLLIWWNYFSVVHANDAVRKAFNVYQVSLQLLVMFFCVNVVRLALLYRSMCVALALMW